MCRARILKVQRLVALFELRGSADGFRGKI